ncbi:MAG: NUDIX hydrolase [Chitinophagaceae bacterium]|nr:NUDIX hydrolase [Chitinophagaceae bacterium]
MNWKKISSKYISRHQYFTAREDVCEMPNGTIVNPYYVVELPLTVCAVALTEDGNVIMVKQYRHPIEEVIYELPGGFVDENEKPEDAIHRELPEETGYTFKDAQHLGKVAANPGVLNNYTELFLLSGGTKTTTQKLDANEEIEIELMPLEQVKQMLQQNKIVQALHVSCLYYGLQYL